MLRLCDTFYLDITLQVVQSFSLSTTMINMKITPTVRVCELPKLSQLRYSPLIRRCNCRGLHDISLVGSIFVWRRYRKHWVHHCSSFYSGLILADQRY